MRNNDPTDVELHDQIEDLVAAGLLDRTTPAYRIAQQVINNGYESLSDQQRVIYDSVIVATLEIRASQLEIERVWDREPE